MPNSDSEAGNSKKLLDIIPFLAKNGYRVLIPEMISYEADKILASGKDLGAYSHTVNIKRSDSSKVGNGREKLIEILKDASLSSDNPSKKNPNIHTITDTGPKKVDEFIRELYKFDDYEQEIRAKIARAKSSNGIGVDLIDPSDTVAYILGNKLAVMHRNAVKNLGDDSIVSMLRKNYTRNNDKPVFILTDDNGLGKKINGLGVSNKYVIGNGALVYSIVDSGLGEHLGFPEDMSALELERKRRIDSEAFRAHKRNIPEQIHRNEQAYSNSIKESAFFESLTRLKKDIEKPSKIVKDTRSSMRNGQKSIAAATLGGR
ncbi:MAG: hypothetical protein R3D71_02995 [Rickettsiales bacterium]